MEFTEMVKSAADDSCKQINIADARWIEFQDRFKGIIDKHLLECWIELDQNKVYEELVTTMCKLLPKYNYVSGAGQSFVNYLIYQTDVAARKVMEAEKGTEAAMS